MLNPSLSPTLIHPARPAPSLAPPRARTIRPASSVPRLGERDVLANVAALVTGGLCPVSMTLVGQLYVGEVLLAGLLLVSVAGFRGRELLESAVFKRFVLFLSALLAGLIFSDFARDTTWNDSMRGWARIVLLTVDAAALTFIALHKPYRKTLWWFLLGEGLGGVAMAAMENHDVLFGWKLGAGTPATLIALCAMTIIPGWTARVGALFALAAVHIYLDFRSMAGFLVAVAAIEFAHEHRNVDRRALVLPGLAMVALLTALLAFSLNSGAQDVAGRRDESNNARMIQVKVASRAIAESPWLGYGSWAKDRKYANEFWKEMGAYLGHAAYRDPNSAELIPAHSQVLQGWIEAGAISLLFFAYLGLRVAGGLRSMALSISFGPDTPLMAFCLVTTLWHLFFSPFSGIHRLPIATTIAIVAVLANAAATGDRPARSRVGGLLRRVFGRPTRPVPTRPAPMRPGADQAAPAQLAGTAAATLGPARGAAGNAIGPSL